MKKIEANIRPHKLDEVHNSLTESGFRGLTVTEVKCYNRQKGRTVLYRGSEYNINFVPKIKLELLCDREKIEKIISIIINSFRTGQTGDGKIFILDVEDAVRIRTGESGMNAILI